MKCPGCGAEIGTSKFCEFCGSQITLEMQKEQEQLNKEGCPKCGSTNIQIKRENQGEVRSKNSKTVLHQTVAVCKDCGYTWYPNGKEKPRKTWLWVLGWIFIFPLPLTLILLKKKDMKPALKYGIIAAAWIIYLLIGISGNADKNNEASENNSNVPSISEHATTQEQIKTEKQTEKLTETDSSVTQPTISFVLSWDEIGEYGEKMTLNEGTDLEMTFIAFHVPVGKYKVTNKSSSGAAQVTVYSGVEFDGQWDQFVAENCASPIVIFADEEGKNIEVKDGQFIKLSDLSENIQFELMK